jgi:hypothetical protein
MAGSTSVSFDDSGTTYAEVPNASFPFSDAFTIEFWVYLTGYGTQASWRVLTLHGDEGGRHFGLWLWHNLNGPVLFDIGGGASLQSARPLTLNTWHHVVGVHTAGGQGQLYINGTLDQTSAAAGSPVAGTTAPFTIGGHGRGFNGLTGRVDEVAYYTYALSRSRIQTHYLTANRSYFDVVRGDVPVGYWRLGELSGTSAVDSSGYGNTGTIFGTPQLNQPCALALDPDPSIYFDGADDHITVPHSSLFDLTLDFTLEAWVYPTSRATWYIIVSKMNHPALNNTFEWRLEQTTGIPLLIQSTSTASPHFGNATNAVPLGKWSHVAVTKTGPTIAHYLNGVANGTNTFGTVSVGVGTDPVCIGSRQAGALPFIGRMDEVAIYRWALPLGSIQSHYLAGQPYRGVVITDAPFAYWPLDEDSGTTVGDISGFNRNGTYAGLAGGHSYYQPAGIPGSASHGVTNANFNTTGPWIDMGYGAPYANPTSFSVEAWVWADNPINQNQGGQIIGCHNNANRGYGVLLYPSAGSTQPYKFFVRILDGIQDISGIGTYALSTWHHMVFTYDGVTYRLYGDGLLDTSAARTAGPGDCGVDNHFGLAFCALGWGGPAGFRGRVDECAYYNYALSAEQVVTHYRIGRALNPLQRRTSIGAWQTTPSVQRWDGTKWITPTVKRWDGTQWV